MSTIPVIVISGDPFCGEELLAASVAEGLGYRCVEPQVVIERAAAWGADHAELTEALRRRPPLAGRFLLKNRTLLSLLQAAIAEEVRNGSVVCFGSAGELLPGEPNNVLRVRVLAPPDARVRIVQERLHLSREGSLAHLHQEDKHRVGWLRHVHGATWDRPARYDLLVNLARMDVRQATDTIIQAASVSLDSARQATALADLALSTRVRAALGLDRQTAHLDLGVEAREGAVAVYGKVPGVADVTLVRRVASGVPGVADLDLNELRIRTGDIPPGLGAGYAARDGEKPAWGLGRLWPDWGIVALGLCFVFLAASLTGRFVSTAGDALFPPAVQNVQTFAGVITDTLCGNGHKALQQGPSPECVKACVRKGGSIKYALYDGKRLYVLSDQRTPENFAGQEVQIRGGWDEKAGVLRVEAIKPLARMFHTKSGLATRGQPNSFWAAY